MSFAESLVENARLTPRQAKLLTLMRDTPDGDADAELVYDGGRTAWLGLRRVAPRTVFALLRMCAVSADGLDRGGGLERYHINGTGRDILARHEAGR